MNPYLYKLGGLSIALAVIVVALAAVFRTADAQSAVPDLSFSKSATDSVPGGQVAFTLAVSNSGGADSHSQTIQDELPTGFEWFLSSSNIECDLDPADGVETTQVLRCGPFVVEARHLNDSRSDFVNGLAFVTVVAEANHCGSWPNTALIRDDVTGVVSSSSLAVLDVTCPTPTPTATPTNPPATATPVPTFPAEPSVIIVTATPTKTPILNIPKPPNTGTGPATESAQDGVGIGLMTTLLGLFAIGIGAAVWAAWGNRHR